MQARKAKAGSLTADGAAAGGRSLVAVSAGGGSDGRILTGRGLQKLPAVFLQILSGRSRRILIRRSERIGSQTGKLQVIRQTGDIGMQFSID